MKYSYTKANRKTVFTSEIQLLFTFFGITLSMLFLTYLFLLFKDYRFEQDKLSIIQQRIDLNTSTSKMKNQVNFIEKQNFFSEKVYTKNMVLKESITNLFDLVPERIVLSEAKLLQNGLILYGVTPNKDIYNFMLQAPLRSIFNKSYSSFYPIENGWLRFVSTNYTNKNDEDLNSED